MKVCVSKDDKDNAFSIDSKPMAVSDLTQELLDRLVEESLEDKVEYVIEGDLPIAKFFKKIQDGTKAGSDLRKAKEAYDAETAEAVASATDPASSSDEDTAASSAEATIDGA